MILNRKLIERIDVIKNGEIPEGYRKTEFGILPCDWEYICFDRLFEEICIKTNESDNLPLYS